MTTSTTTPPATLTERYVHATLRTVPESRRTDLGDELRSTISDMVEARIDDGADPVNAERDTLVELGDPDLLAARYTDQRLQLLGPRFYLVWKRLTLQLLTWVPALIGILVATVAVVDGGRTVGEVIVDAGGAAIGTAFQIVFWTTGVFALLDRIVTDEPKAWAPDALPDAPVDREHSFGDAVAGVGWNIVVAAALVLQQFRSWVRGSDGDDVAVLDPDLWGSWLPVLLVLVAVSIAIEVWKYRCGWTTAVVVATLVEAAAFCGILLWLTLERRLLGAEFAEAVGLDGASSDGVHTAIAVGVVVVGGFQVVDALVKAVAHRRRAP